MPRFRVLRVNAAHKARLGQEEKRGTQVPRGRPDRREKRASLVPKVCRGHPGKKAHLVCKARLDQEEKKVTRGHKEKRASLRIRRASMNSSAASQNWRNS